MLNSPSQKRALWKKGRKEERSQGRCNMHFTPAGKTASLQSPLVLPAPWKEGGQESVFLYRNKETSECWGPLSCWCVQTLLQQDLQVQHCIPLVEPRNTSNLWRTPREVLNWWIFKQVIFCSCLLGVFPQVFFFLFCLFVFWYLWAQVELVPLIWVPIPKQEQFIF